MAALEWNIGLHAQRQPYLAGRDAGLQRFRRRPLTEPGKHEIRYQRRPASAELICDGAVEFTATHEERA